ncbi:MAG: non-homologous end-joining DNA ligase [Candidatus Bathyarchaeia archaeon]|jgi:DNA ligase D-like protein (predicted ligase)/DNA ligase D-like protein (predicted 3'-phosphoesterase)
MKPTKYKPMLAQATQAPFNSRHWIFEIKWDGIRAISYVNEDLKIISRNGNELKHNFPELQELKDVTKNAVLDGEIVVMKDGKADFQAVMERSRITGYRNIGYLSGESPATYVVFDILEKDGKSLTDTSLIERKRILKDVVKEGKHVILSIFEEEAGESYYEAALKGGVEGIVAKKKDSLYEPGTRSRSWLKIKPLTSCDCTIFGYTSGQGNRKNTFGALILGLYDGVTPVFVGKVGTGFSEEALEILMQTFRDLQVNETTLTKVDVSESVTWLEPVLVCEIAYQSVTKEDKLRMPRFHRLRSDKTAIECTFDQVRPVGLEKYAAKRDFTLTPEPVGAVEQQEGNAFVVQEHHSRRLHYDFRLEKDGVLKSWAVPKGIPEKTGEKHLAVEVEDHPLEYRKFEGTIPPGQYGAGSVKIFDKGSYEPVFWKEDEIEVALKGERLHGKYALVRFKRAGPKQWLLIKAKD